MTTNTMTHHAPLRAGDYLVSNNRRFFAILQHDGNFCVYRGSGPADNQGLCWAADNPTGTFCDLNMWLQAEDGNLVTYASLTPGGKQAAIWATNLQTGPGNYYAVMQDDGYFCQYAGVPSAEGANNVGTRQALWHTQFVFGKWMPPGSAMIGGTPSETMPIPWRDVTLAAAGAVPKVGAVLKGITEKLWSQGSVWDQVKQQVQAMIDQAIAATVMEQLTAEMNGLKGVYKNYLAKCDVFNGLTAPPDSEEAKAVRAAMREQYNFTKNYFDGSAPKFMLASQAIPTLQLMAAVATMHLAIYRDGLIHGASWDALPSDLKSLGEDLRDETGLVAKYCNWVDSWVSTALPAKPATAPRTVAEINNACGQWLARNSYIRLMTLNVLDARALWPYVDTAVCPAGQVPPKLTREILSDGFGYFDTTLPLDLPHPLSWRTTSLPAPETPPKRLTHLAIDGAGYINGVTVSYDDGAPEPREGSPLQGQLTLPFGWAGYISPNNPVVNVSVSTTGDWNSADLPGGDGLGDLSTMMLVFKDGTTSGLMGNAAKVGGLGSAQFPGHVLTSIYLTADRSYANGVVFGFRLADCWD